MANPVKTIGSDVDARTQAGNQVTKRNETRKANEAVQRKARGGRDLTQMERYQIDALNKASNACGILADQIKNGRPVNLDTLNAAALLAANAMLSMGS